MKYLIWLLVIVLAIWAFKRSRRVNSDTSQEKPPAPRLHLPIWRSVCIAASTCRKTKPSRAKKAFTAAPSTAQPLTTATRSEHPGLTRPSTAHPRHV